LVRETHQDPEVAKALNERFIPVRMEGRSHMDLVQKYGVRGAPTTVLLSPDGTEKHRFVGFQSAAELLKELSQSGLS
jgi:uncharacterized protein YyaL (SSP411 family)